MNRKYITTECEGTDSQASGEASLIENIHESSLMGPSWSFCVCVFVFELYYSHHSVLPDVYLSGHPGHPDVCQHHHTTSVFITNPLPPPLFPVTWEAEVGHVHWDIRHGRGETGWLIGDISPEGTLSAFWQKKMSDSECLLCWQTWVPRGRWLERARMAKDMPGRGQQTRSRKLCHHQNYKGVKWLLRW